MKDKRKKNRFNVINLSKFRIKRKLFAFFFIKNFILAVLYTIIRRIRVNFAV